jgi:chaperonin cofactor prefoldin
MIDRVKTLEEKNSTLEVKIKTLVEKVEYLEKMVNDSFDQRMRARHERKA